jgi:endonuclease/exonuclease/phosphatase (EEP) superfamily protein YafD
MASIRILTCNLYNGAASPSALAEVIAAAQPDVVAAQELGPDAAEVLAAALPYGLVAPALNHTGKGIVLRHPGEVAIFPLPGREGMRAVLTPEAWPALGRETELLNLHFANPIDRPWKVTRRIRRDQVAAVIRHVAVRSDPLIAVGDLNSTPLWPSYRRLIRVMRDGVNDSGTTDPTWGPWWWFPRLLRIDHVLVHGGVTVTHAETIRIRGTDHSAVLVDVSTT